MKAGFAVLIATVALVAVSQGMQTEAGSARADANSPNDYMLVSGDVECRVTQSAVREKIARLALEPGCGEPSHPISQAAMIEENDDGTIDLLGRDGQAVIRFAAAEGGTHVSYEPQSPLVRLVALD